MTGKQNPYDSILVEIAQLYSPKVNLPVGFDRVLTLLVQFPESKTLVGLRLQIIYLRASFTYIHFDKKSILFFSIPNAFPT